MTLAVGTINGVYSVGFIFSERRMRQEASTTTAEIEDTMGKRDPETCENAITTPADIKNMYDQIDGLRMYNGRE